MADRRKVLALALKKQKENIVDHWHVEDNKADLFSKEILGNSTLNQSHSSEQLLEIIMQKGEVFQEKFVKILEKSRQENHQILAKAIRKTVAEILDYLKDASIPVSRLKELYKSPDWRKHVAFPREKFFVDLSNEDKVLDLNFETEVIDLKHFNRMKEFSDDNDITIKYKPKSVQRMEEVLNLFFEPDKPKNLMNVMLLLGDAGLGKTITVKRMAFKWAEGKKELNSFQLLLVVFLKRIGNNMSVIDVLFEESYFDDQDEFELYLSESDNCKSVLLILDGWDDVAFSEESEWWGLITGKKYPGLNIIITSRPYTLACNQLKKVSPYAKVTLTGVESESKKRFIEGFLSEEKQTSDSLFQLSQQYRIDGNILTSPLFFTLFCIVNHEECRDKVELTNQSALETHTHILSAFLKVILNREISRHHRKETDTVSFQRSPLEETAHLSDDSDLWQRMLYFVGKMSYETLQKQQDKFDDKLLAKYKLKRKTIESLGMFSFTNEQDVCVFHHKMYQEYFAAMYIADQRFEISSLAQMIEAAPRDSSLQDIFKHNLNAIQLACGLSEKFYFELLDKLSTKVCIHKDNYIPCHIDIQELLALCYEAGCQDEKIIKAFEKFICKIRIVEKDVQLHDFHPYHNRCYSEVLKQFSDETAKVLLNEWYRLDIKLKNEKEQRNVGSELTKAILGSNSAECEVQCGMGFVCLTLLSKFCIPSVKKLIVRGKRWVMDFQTLQSIFPNLKNVDVDVFVFRDGVLKPDQEPTIDTFITFRVQGSTHKKFPVHSVRCLCIQTRLEKIQVKGHDMLTVFDSKTLNVPTWSQLETLSLVWCEINEKNTKVLVEILKRTPKLKRLKLQENSQISIPDLCEGIKYLRKLTSLNLSCTGINADNTERFCETIASLPQLEQLNVSFNRKIDIECLCKTISEKMPKLSTLYIYNSLKETAILFASHIPDMKNLYCLGLYSEDIQDHLKEFVNSLCKSEQIKIVEILEERKNVNSTLSVLQKQTLKERNIDVKEISFEDEDNYMYDENNSKSQKNI